MVTVDFRVRVPLAEAGGSPSSPLPSFLERYVGLYGAETARRLLHASPADLLTQMDEAGVEWAVLQAELEWGDYRKYNAAVRRLVEDHPDRFVGFVTIDPDGIHDPVADVSRAREWGAAGVNLQPWVLKRRADDPSLYPLYEYCQEHDLIVAVHTGVNFSTDRSIDFGRPLHLDRVACDFPGLRLVANHAGWPWVAEMVAVAWKHPRVYLELGGIAPKYVGRPGTGWEPLVVYGSSVLSNKILWATDWPLLPFERSLGELEQLPWPEAVKAAVRGGNAATLLGSRAPGRASVRGGPS